MESPEKARFPTLCPHGSGRCTTGRQEGYPGAESLYGTRQGQRQPFSCGHSCPKCQNHEVTYRHLR